MSRASTTSTTPWIGPLPTDSTTSVISFAPATSTVIRTALSRAVPFGLAQLDRLAVEQQPDANVSFSPVEVVEADERVEAAKFTTQRVADSAAGVQADAPIVM